MQISVVGLGKLGTPMAACLADKDYSVLGVDVNPQTVALINEGRSPLYEPGVPELLVRSRGRLRATTDHREAISSTDVTFVVVPTPSEPNGAFSLRYVLQAAVELGRALAEKQGYHLFVLTSTVLPGSTQHGLLPVLVRESGKRCPQDFGLCYSPEFIALGTVIRDFLRPDFVLIGESDERAGQMLAEIYERVCENHPPVRRMNFVNAELTKVAVNTYITTKISFANMISALCEALPGGDVDIVADALGLFTGIGRRYLRGGLGYGGPCLPRDNVALTYLARQLGRPTGLAEAVDAYSRTIVPRIFKRIAPLVSADSRIGFLGVAYKPGTNVVEASQAADLALQLAGLSREVIIYDPVATDAAKRVLGDRVRYAKNMQEAVTEADVIVIATPDAEFVGLTPEMLPGNRPVVVDIWRVLRDRFAADPRVRYVPIGIGADDGGVEARLAALWRQGAA